ncbi:MAG: hypothetical protein LKJ69_12885 [Lactobacillus sp.]|nr:hypothetical protein [Lactobacillus sp.]MCI2034262.1 hypothetical protein [Lactobacillus sp.]
MLLPARTAVLNELYKKGNATVEEIMADLKCKYGTERQFTKKLYSDHCMALEANGMVELSGYELDDAGELQMEYRITDDGRSTVHKYVAKKYQDE